MSVASVISEPSRLRASARLMRTRMSRVAAKDERLPMKQVLSNLIESLDKHVARASTSLLSCREFEQVEALERRIVELQRQTREARFREDFDSCAALQNKIGRALTMRERHLRQMDVVRNVARAIDRGDVGALARFARDANAVAVPPPPPPLAPVRRTTGVRSTATNPRTTLATTTTSRRERDYDDAVASGDAYSTPTVERATTTARSHWKRARRALEAEKRDATRDEDFESCMNIQAIIQMIDRAEKNLRELNMGLKRAVAIEDYPLCLELKKKIEVESKEVEDIVSSVNERTERNGGGSRRTYESPRATAATTTMTTPLSFTEETRRLRDTDRHWPASSPPRRDPREVAAEIDRLESALWNAQLDEDFTRCAVLQKRIASLRPP